jgi:hypothetical protein
MRPREYFDRNPFIDDGKGGRRRADIKDRSRSAPSGRKPFKFSSPGKTVRIEILFSTFPFSLSLSLAWWK